MNRLCCLTLSLLGFGSAAHAAVNVQQLYQFSEPTQWVENIVVRPNGQLLLTTYDDARLYALDPQGKNAVPQVVAQLPNATALTGIAEVAPDVFAFAGGVFNITDFSFEYSSGQIAVINLKCSQENGSHPVRTAATVPSAKLLNGLVALPDHPHVVLSSDSKTGTIYRTNTITGHVDVIFQDDRLTPGPNIQYVPLGVNGLKIHGGYLYLTNSERLFFARIKINDAGDAIGALEIITQLPSNPAKVPDDFAITREGTVYVAAHPDTLGRITPDGKWSVLVEGQNGGVTLDTPTAVALSKDESTIYAVTGGSAEAGGKGGQIVAVSL